MKIIHTADWHIGKSVNEYSMLDRQKENLNQLIETVKQENCDVLIIAGDIYDRSLPSQEAISVVNTVFSRLVSETETVILVISGNHDSPQLVEYGSSIFKSKSLYIEGTFKNSIQKVSVKDTDFYLLPFVTPFQLNNQLQDSTIKTFEDVIIYQLNMIQTQLDKSKNNVLIAHAYVIDSTVIPEQSDSMRPLSIGTIEYVNAKIFEDFNYVALGHIHKPMTLSHNCFYSGALYKYSKSEANYPIGFNIVNIENKKLTVNRKEFTLSKDMKIIRDSLSRLLKGYDEDYVFFELTDKLYQLDAMNRLQKHYPFAMGLEYINIQPATKTETQTKQSIDNKSVYDLFSQFFIDYTGDNLSEPEDKIIQETLRESDII